MSALLELKGVTKSFGSLVANHKVDFSCEKGSIISLLGENGAGKSTLMKIICGIYEPDEGEIFFSGKKVNIKSPREASKLGIQMVHQHFMLVDSLTVAENIVLGNEPHKHGIYQRKEAEKNILLLAKKYGFTIDPSEKVGNLSVGAKQRTEIIKALYRGAKLLILDEPTAVLTPKEVDDLFKVIKQLKSNGISIIIITHKLKETMELSDMVYVLRHGEMIGKVHTNQTNEHELTTMMVGRELKQVEKLAPKLRDIVLQINDLTFVNEEGITALKDLHLQVHGGEVFGIAGVEGNGQKELVEVISGISKGWEGKVEIHQQSIKERSSRQVIDMGVATIHSDRHERGLLLDLAAKDSMLLGYQHRKDMKNKFGFLHLKKIQEVAKNIFKMYDVRPMNIHQVSSSFSGGNQQKFIVGREFYRNPTLAIVAYPTRGVDIGAAEIIHDSILRLRDSGTAVLLLTTEFDELFKLSDRIGVLYEGSLIASGDAKDFNINKLGHYMGGGQSIVQ